MKRHGFGLTMAAGLALIGMLNHRFVFANIEPSLRADYILVEKSKRTLTLLHQGKEIKTYKIALGRKPVGHKEKAGDMRTPEGKYTIDLKKRNSAFHLALRISYPNKRDKVRASKQKVPPGGDIMIHGLKNGWGWVGSFHAMKDWTAGCIAVTNPEIEEIWTLVQNGTTVEIQP